MRIIKAHTFQQTSLYKKDYFNIRTLKIKIEYYLMNWKQISYGINRFQVYNNFYLKFNVLFYFEYFLKYDNDLDNKKYYLI